MVGLEVMALILLVGCSAPVTDNPKEVGQAAVQEQSTEPEITEETPEMAEEPITEIPAPIAEEEPGYEIFNPSLTYPGAYNGPLYGTSEQVGSASMDSYFKNLDQNGINFL